MNKRCYLLTLFICSIVLIAWIFRYTYAWRGYFAIGGEVFLLPLPFIFFKEFLQAKTKKRKKVR